MKAVKLYKINWNLDKLTPEEKNEVKKTLPTSKGFKADDSFDVIEKVPGLLHKKFGYEVIDFSYTEIPIYDDFETLLKTYTPKGEKPKKIYLKSGELSAFGEECVNKLKRDISKRFLLEGRDTADDEMPEQMDMVMLAIETIFGVDWDEADEDSIFQLIDKETNSHIKVKLKKMDKDEDDDEDDEDAEYADHEEEDEEDDDDDKEEKDDD
jgi:hypothetical protein